jgi:hypothetical protein
VCVCVCVCEREREREREREYLHSHPTNNRCVKGMDVVQMIENVKCGKDDKPFDDITIVNIRILDQPPTAK